jgi:hypothetical protein
LDFNEETLHYTSGKLAETKKKHGRKTELKLVKNSVQNLLRNGGKGAAEYDLIYCSGLYDYLNDRICKALNTYFYDLLLPGGLLIVGNFGPHLPVRHFIEHFLEWFLIFRDSKQLGALAPEQAGPDDCAVIAEPTGSNQFFEARANANERSRVSQGIRGTEPARLHRERAFWVDRIDPAEPLVLGDGPLHVSADDVALLQTTRGLRHTDGADLVLVHKTGEPLPASGFWRHVVHGAAVDDLLHDLHS